jgi:phenylacetate-CoA ligase
MISATAALDRNPLDAWAAGRMGISADALTRNTIAVYQLGALRETIAWARRQSSFYAAQLAAFSPEWPRSIEDFARAPLTSPADIIVRPHAFLCVPQSEISRIVTLETSGTSGARKRIFFTAGDQDLALDFFAHGVSGMAEQGGRMFIALPGEREGSVGFQLARGIARAGIVSIPHGLILDPAAAIARMDEEKATLLIGLPVQVLALALETGDLARRVFRRLHSIVLCSDHVPRCLVDRIRRVTGCEIFEHYGSTEMGLGGGVDCRAHAGYHLREPDLYFEIVSPLNREPLPEGELGEVVFTTLGRTGMPLIRYRSGDLGRILPGPCACGSPLRRLARIENRIDSAVPLGPAGSISISALDEVLFANPQVHDFSATLVLGTPNELHVRIHAPHADPGTSGSVEHALLQLPPLARSCAAGELRLFIHLQKEPFPVTGAKRNIGVQAHV